MAPHAHGRSSFAPHAKPGPDVPDRYHAASSSPVMARACHRTARTTRGSSSQPKPISARGQAMDDARRRRRRFPGDAGGPEAAILGLAMREDIFAGPTDAVILGIGSELVEEDQLPDRAAIFRRIARTRLLPVTVRRLGVEDGRDGVGSHRRVAAFHDVRVAIGPIEQLPQSKMPNRRVLRFEQPVQRVLAESRWQTGHQPSSSNLTASAGDPGARVGRPGVDGAAAS